MLATLWALARASPTRHRWRRRPLATLTVPVGSQLLRMTQETPTQFWNDSCAVAELEYAVERGATGATSNPTIVLEVMRKESEHWVPRVRELAASHPRWTEVELTWALIEEMAIRGAAILAARVRGARRQEGPPVAPDEPGELSRPRADGRAGGCASAPSPRTSRSSSRSRAPGSSAIEEATARGINITATVTFTVAAVPRRGRGGRAWARPSEAAGGDVGLDGADLLAHDRPARRLDEGPHRARRARRPPRRRRTGPASPPSSGPTGSTGSAATGPGCSRRPTAIGCTGPSSSAATSS